MDYILSLLSEFTSDPDKVRLLFGLVVGLAVILIAFALVSLVNNILDPVRARVDQEVEDGRRSQDVRTQQSGLQRVLLAVGRIAVPASQKELNKTKERLSWAGYRSPNAVGIFYSVKMLAMIGLPVVVFLVASRIGGLATFHVLFAAWAAAAIGVIVPNRWLTQKGNSRKKRLRDGFPDALDLLVVCSEAGMGLGSAIQRVADELVVSHPELATEFSQVSAEMRAGVERIDSLRNLATRNGLEDFRGFVATLSQAMRFGSSIAETLRIYSEEFRDKRMQRAEEIAAKMPVKMIFPLALCMLPAFMIVAMGPSWLKVTRVFGNM